MAKIATASAQTKAKYIQEAMARIVTAPASKEELAAAAEKEG